MNTLDALVIAGDVCNIFRVCKSVMLYRFLCHIHSTIYVRRGRKAAFWYERRSTCRRAIENATKPSFDVDDRNALWSRRILRCFCWPPTNQHWLQPAVAVVAVGVADMLPHCCRHGRSYRYYCLHFQFPRTYVVCVVGFRIAHATLVCVVHVRLIRLLSLN